MPQPTKLLLVVPPVRLNRQEFGYLVHWPRHAIVIAAELGDEYDVQILDVTAIALTDDVTVVADYVHNAEGRAASDRGLFNIEQGRVFVRENTLATIQF